MPGWRIWTLMLLPVLAAVVILVTRPGGIRELQHVRLRWLSLIWVAGTVQLVRTWHPTLAAPFLRPHDGVLPVVVMWLLGVAFVAANLPTRPPCVRTKLPLLTDAIPTPPLPVVGELA